MDIFHRWERVGRDVFWMGGGRWTFFMSGVGGWKYFWGK